MTVFYILATCMALVATALLLWPLLRPSSAKLVERRAANVSIFRDQLSDLDSDLARGTLSADQYAEARTELERRLLDESRQDESAVIGAARPRYAAALVLALALPLASAALYWRLGEPEAIALTAIPAPGTERSEEQVNHMVEQLAQRLQKQPDNTEGWFVLARSYYAMGKFAEAAAAFEKVAALEPNDANVMADYADALAMSQGRELSGQPEALIERALKIDPTQWKALAMAGTLAFDRKDYAQAVSLWERLRAAQPPDSPLAKSIQSSIAEARLLGKLGPSTALAGAAVPPATATPSPASKPVAPPTASAASSGKSVSGTVSLSQTLAGKAAPTDTVFVFARPADGSKMPLAILRAQVKDLPLTFTLDDSSAMSPAATLSSHEQVVVLARVSRGGGAAAQSGDLEGLSQPIKVGTRGLNLTIDRIIP